MDPWGRVVGRLLSFDDKDGAEGEGKQATDGRERERERGDGEEGELWVGEIDLDIVERVRREMPLVRNENVLKDV